MSDYRSSFGEKKENTNSQAQGKEPQGKISRTQGTEPSGEVSEAQGIDLNEKVTVAKNVKQAEKDVPSSSSENELSFRTRGQRNPKGLPRVFFACHPEDF